MNTITRTDKVNYYLDIAEAVSKRCTCRRRWFGAIIVQNDEVIASGFVGAPRSRKNCIDLDYCVREKLNIPRGERYELCRSVHSEANALISAARRDMIGATLYMVCLDPVTRALVPGTNSCSMCKRLIINAGIAQVIVRDTPTAYRVIDVEDWIQHDESLEGKFGY
jgi:dCMP deaminase